MGVHLLEFHLMGCHGRTRGVEDEEASAGGALVYGPNIAVLARLSSVPDSCTLWLWAACFFNAFRLRARGRVDHGGCDCESVDSLMHHEQANETRRRGQWQVRELAWIEMRIEVEGKGEGGGVWEAGRSYYY